MNSFNSQAGNLYVEGLKKLMQQYQKYLEVNGDYVKMRTANKRLFFRITFILMTKGPYFAIMVHMQENSFGALVNIIIVLQIMFSQ